MPEIKDKDWLPYSGGQHFTERVSHQKSLESEKNFLFGTNFDTNWSEKATFRTKVDYVYIHPCLNKHMSFQYNLNSSQTYIAPVMVR